MVEEVTLEIDTVKLEPGDLVAVFSDGIPEATTDGETFLDLDKVLEILDNHRTADLSDIRERIVSVVDDFLGGESGSDDVTLLLLRRKAEQ